MKKPHKPASTTPQLKEPRAHVAAATAGDREERTWLLNTSREHK